MSWDDLEGEIAELFGELAADPLDLISVEAYAAEMRERKRADKARSRESCTLVRRTCRAPGCAEDIRGPRAWYCETHRLEMSRQQARESTRRSRASIYEDPKARAAYRAKVAAYQRKSRKGKPTRPARECHVVGCPRPKRRVQGARYCDGHAR